VLVTSLEHRQELTAMGRGGAHPQDTFAPLFALVSLLVPVMLLIRTYAMERQHRTQFIHMQLLHYNTDGYDLRSAVPHRLRQRMEVTDATELITEEFDTLTVLNCRLSQSDIQRIVTQEGELACLQTLYRIVNKFDQLVIEHGCHKVRGARSPHGPVCSFLPHPTHLPGWSASWEWVVRPPQPLG
jgi:hypothetical protein